MVRLSDGFGELQKVTSRYDLARNSGSGTKKTGGGMEALGLDTYDKDIGAIKFSEIVSAFSFVLDMVEGQPQGHSLRTCFIGMTLGGRLGLSDDDLSALFYALLIKDAGCSSNASRISSLFGADEFVVKRAFKLINWSRLPDTAIYAAKNVTPDGSMWKRAFQFVRASKGGPKTTGELIQIRCDRGAEIARFVGFPEKTAQAIHSLDEHWDGSGYPDNLRKHEIPLLARICGFAQTVEVFYSNYGPDGAEQMARARRKRWFDPTLVDAFFANTSYIWESLSDSEVVESVYSLEPKERIIPATPRLLDLTAMAFARIIDAKSPFTYEHSDGVARASVEIAKRMGYSAPKRQDIWRAALLHDIGKLGVPNTILDKPGKLTSGEFERVKTHPRLTYEALLRIPILNSLAEIAASHHEKLDGSGYHRGITGDQMSVPSRILAVADIYDALVQERPYRSAMPTEKVLAILEEESISKLCPEVVGVMTEIIHDGTLDKPQEATPDEGMKP